MRSSGQRQQLALGLACLAALLPPAATARVKASAWAPALRVVEAIVDGRSAAAISASSQLLKQIPQPLLDTLVALAAMASKSNEQPAPLLARATAQSPNDALIYYWAGRLALARGKLGRARDAFRKAYAIGGDRPAIQLAFASFDRSPHGLDALVRSARKSPLLARALHFPSPKQGAVALLELLLEGFPRPQELQRTQAHLYFRSGALLEAAALLRQLHQRLKGDPDLGQMHARCLVELGQRAQALPLARALSEAHPNHGPAQLLYGQLLLERGDAEAALPALQRAADAMPRHAPGLAALGEACRRVQRWPCAKKFFGYALRQDPRVQSAHYGLGLIAQQEGETKRAEQHFQIALSLDPSEASSYTALAQLLQLAKKQAAARRLLAQGRRAETQRRRFAKRLGRERRQLALTLEALTACGCRGACTGGEQQACHAATAALSPSRRRYFRAHLALGRGKHARARELLRSVLPLLGPALFREEASTLVQRVTIGGQVARLRRKLPLIHSDLLR